MNPLSRASNIPACQRSNTRRRIEPLDILCAQEPVAASPQRVAPGVIKGLAIWVIGSYDFAFACVGGGAAGVLRLGRLGLIALNRWLGKADPGRVACRLVAVFHVQLPQDVLDVGLNGVFRYQQGFR